MIELAKSRIIIEGEIFELRRTVNQLNLAINGFEEIELAEKAEQQTAKSWSTWILSPLYKKAVDTPEEKERKANERLQRLHAKDMKQRASVLTQAKLMECEKRLRERKEQSRVEDTRDDAKIFRLEESLRLKRESAEAERQQAKWEADQKLWREKYEKEKVERAAREKARKAQEEKERLAREAKERARKAQLEKERIEREKAEKARQAREAAEKKAREKQEREIMHKARADQITRMRKEDELKGIFRDSYEKLVAKEPVRDGLGFILYFPTHGYEKQTVPQTVPQPVSYTRLACSHAGWWDKVNTHGTCEECDGFRRNYYLQCPGCKMKACPQCQAKLRPRGYNETRRPRQSRAYPTQATSRLYDEDYSHADDYF